ncbi:MAG: insulinase family protein [Deltaproteobacteria bacterium]|nr:insulinase family protein [Deltaproteobacteria bacterium]
MPGRRGHTISSPMGGFLLIVTLAITMPVCIPKSSHAQTPPPPLSVVDRRTGPAGSLLLVEANHALPLVHVVVAVRSGSSWDSRKKDGLMNLMGEVARRAAAGKTRDQLDKQLDALGATLDVRTDADSLRFEGHVLTRHLDAYLQIAADVLLRPDFPVAEFTRTRREVLADIDELRNDDQALGARFFVRNLYSDHPYGHPPEGDRSSLDRIRRDDLVAHHRRHVVGPNVIVAAAGDVDAADFSARIHRLFAALSPGPAPGPNPLAARTPQPPQGWRIQIVDKPDRQQAQVLFGHMGVRATDPDYVPLLVAISSFGGHGMKSTLMDEVRTKRGLAYGTYMNLSGRLNHAPVTGWFFTSNAKAVSTLKLVLRLYVALMEKGIDDRRLAFAKEFLAGTYASTVDDPAHRLDARVSAEIAGLTASFVDDLPARVRAVTAAQVKAAVLRHVHARDLAITMVATASDVWPRLIEAKVQPGAIDVVPYESY